MSREIMGGDQGDGAYQEVNDGLPEEKVEGQADKPIGGRRN